MRLIVRFPRRAGGFSGVSSQGLILSGLVHFGVILGLLMVANRRSTEPIRFPVTTVRLIAGGRLAPPGRPAPPAPAPAPAPPAKRPQPPATKAVPKAPSPAPPKPTTPRQHAADPAPKAAEPAAVSSPEPAASPGQSEPAGSMAVGLAPDASSGDPGGVPSIDSAAFPFAYYRDLITNRLRAVWSRPVVPGGLTAPLRVTVRFEILRGGALADISLASPSGHPPLDRSALRAAYDANPLPPLPDEFEGDRLAVNFYFELRPEP